MENTENTIVEVADSYANTEELLKKFPIINPTPIYIQPEKNIQNRLLNGFENWNRGFEAWKAWGDILYTPASLYNVHAVHLTLTEYQNAMKVTLRNNDIQMGDFRHMIVVDDWTAIHYEIATINRESDKVTPGSVMEFVNFKDYGEGLGTRVVEGWAGTKGADYTDLGCFQTAKERAAQQKMKDKIAGTVIAETDDLEKKYPVQRPTSIRTDLGEKIRKTILEDFDHWNQGVEVWSAWADTYYAENLQYHKDAVTLSLNEYKDEVKTEAKTASIQRLYFENMLISGDWAAIHYRTIVQDKASGNKEAGSRMQFLRFAETGDGLKVTECWTK